MKCHILNRREAVRITSHGSLPGARQHQEPNARLVRPLRAKPTHPFLFMIMGRKGRI
jgi:hypothetical protein